MPNFDVQESKGVIAAIVKENGTTKSIKDTSNVDIDYLNGGSSAVDQFVFLECSTSYSVDSNKTTNKQDLVGSQNQKISEGSIEDTFNYDALAIIDEVGGAFGDRVIEVTDNPYHGVDGSANTQYVMTPQGFRQMFRGGNTYTVRLFFGCDLDSNEDADITTAREVVDMERCHISSNNTSASGGSDVTLSLTFEAEGVSYPAAYDSVPE